MSTRTLGVAGPTVFPLGLGAMGMSAMYGPSDDAESIATIHAALDAGVDLIDTGDFYAMGRNELLVGRALAGRTHQALVSVKFGALRSPDGGWIGVDGRPASVKNFAAMSLARLGVEQLGIYRLARLDPNVPIEDTVGAIADLVKAGYVRYIGLSEVGPETLRRAAAVHPIVDVQLEYSLMSRGPERAMVRVLDELGVGMTAYGVLSRGLLAGSGAKGPTDYRSYLPRFQGENLQRNQQLVEALTAVAARHDATPGQLAVAWVSSRGPRIVPVLGARTRTQLAEALGALRITLTAADLAAIEAAVPPEAVAGTRYDAWQMSVLDSERA